MFFENTYAFDNNFVTWQELKLKSARLLVTLEKRKTRRDKTLPKISWKIILLKCLYESEHFELLCAVFAAGSVQATFRYA